MSRERMVGERLFGVFLAGVLVVCFGGIVVNIEDEDFWGAVGWFVLALTMAVVFVVTDFGDADESDEVQP